MTVDRRSFLVGALAGVTTGAAAGLATARLASPPSRRPPPGTEFADRRSYSQSSEDLVLADLLVHLKVDKPAYLDVGAHDPIYANNTYLFYERGCRGVLVEPNPELTPKLRGVRPGDVVLEVGLGASGDADEEADYYLVGKGGELNTFSVEDVRELKAKMGDGVVRAVIKRKLVNVNKVMGEHFGGRAPDLVSLDTEGFDLTILRSVDFQRFRPTVFCVETLAGDGVEANADILALMQSKDYEPRGGSWLNTIFVDRHYLRGLASRGG